MNLKIGADPELFVTLGSKFHSAHALIPGTKEEPHVVNNGAVQVDGMALEFNIDPANNEAEFVFNTNAVLETLREMVPSEFQLALVSSAHFDPKHMGDQPLEALILGCDPDYNAYTEGENPPPQAPGTLRTAAGHIHLGWDDGFDTTDPMHISMCSRLARALDVTLGLPSLLEDEAGDERRQLYGKAGAFRPKSYGMEYRVLSNYWLTTEQHMRLVYGRAKNAFDNMMMGFNYYDELVKQTQLDAETLINTNDREMAQRAMGVMGIG